MTTTLPIPPPLSWIFRLSYGPENGPSFAIIKTPISQKYVDINEPFSADSQYSLWAKFLHYLSFSPDATTKIESSFYEFLRFFGQLQNYDSR